MKSTTNPHASHSRRFSLFSKTALLLAISLLGLSVGATALAEPLVMEGTLGNITHNYTPPVAPDPVFLTPGYPSSLRANIELEVPASMSTTNLSGSVQFNLQVGGGLVLQIDPFSGPLSLALRFSYYKSNESPVQNIFTVGTPTVILHDYIGAEPLSFTATPAALFTSNSFDVTFYATINSRVSFSGIEAILPILSGEADYSLDNLYTSFTVRDPNYEGPSVAPYYPMVTYADPVPEASSLLLMGAGGVALALRRLRFRRVD